VQNKWLFAFSDICSNLATVHFYLFLPQSCHNALCLLKVRFEGKQDKLPRVDLRPRSATFFAALHGSPREGRAVLAAEPLF
jgi:hypothetical protein